MNIFYIILYHIMFATPSKINKLDKHMLSVCFNPSYEKKIVSWDHHSKQDLNKINMFETSHQHDQLEAAHHKQKQ